MSKSQVFYVGCIAVGLVLMFAAVGCGLLLMSGRFAE